MMPAPPTVKRYGFEGFKLSRVWSYHFLAYACLHPVYTLVLGSHLTSKVILRGFPNDFLIASPNPRSQSSSNSSLKK